MEKRFLPLLLMIVLSTIVCAQSRSEREALDLAESFFGQNAAFARGTLKPKQPSLAVVPQQVIQEQIQKELEAPMKGFAKKAGFYIINDEANHRFVIVSADNQQYEILGYSNNSEFDTEHIPGGLLSLLEQYNQEYEYIQNGGSLMTRASNTRAMKAVAPFIKSNWDQGNNDMMNVGEYVFNKYCPKDPTTGTPCVTGCVATALAQVLNYYQMPKSLPDSVISYETKDRGIQLNENLSDYQLDWNNMCDWYMDRRNGFPSTTTAQRNAVGKLMYVCGLAVRMNYTSNNSSASTYNAPYALKKFFGYNPNISYHIKEFYSDEEWTEMIQTELDARRPVFYDGRKGDYGHTFLLVGCDDSGHYCFNFGWGGSHNDEYFSLASITPQGHDYSDEQSMSIGISSNTFGTKQDVWYADKFSLNRTSVALGGNVTATLTKPACYSADANSYNTKWYGEFGIAIYDKNFGLISENKIFSPPQGIKIYSYYPSPFDYIITFDTNTFKEGEQYIIAPYAKGTGSAAPTRMRTLHAASDYYIATVKNGTVTLELMGAPSSDPPATKVYVTGITLNTTTASLSVGQILQLTPTISPSNATDKSVTWTSSNTTVATVSSAGLVTAKAAGNATITCKANDGSNKQATCTITVNEETPQIEFVSATCENTNLSSLTKSDKLRIKASFKNTGATASIRTCLIITNQGVTEIITRGEMDTREFKKNETIQLTYECDLSSLSENTSYKACVMYYDDWNKKSWIYNNDYMFDFTIVPGSSNVAVTNISLSPWTILLATGASRQLTATITPEDASNKNVTWSSSNTSVATVNSSGVVTAKAVGEAVITCQASDGSGISRNCNVQVIASGAPDISFVSTTCSNSSLSGLKSGDKLYLKATFKNNGVKANIYTQVRVRNASTQKTLYYSSNMLKTFPANSEVSFDYEYELPTIETGSYEVYVVYYDGWTENNYTWYRNDNCMINFTVGTASTPKIQILSSKLNNTNPQSLTQDDKLSLTVEYKNTGATINDFETAIIFFTSDGEWHDSFVSEKSAFESNATLTITKSLGLNNIPPGSYKVALMYFDYWDRNSWIYKDNTALYDITINAKTLVETIYADESKDKDVYYDLQGRRIDMPNKAGLYIRNGKKVVNSR